MIIRPVRQRLAGACRLRSALLTSISHDLKTPLAAVLGAAGTLRLERSSKILVQHRVEVDLAKELPMVEIDPVLFEQALFNPLDNAAKYASAGTTVRIQSWHDRNTVSVQVLDEGEGIPPGDLENIFDTFYRARKADHVRAGTGLGLAISRGFVEAMQGTISAANRMDRRGPCLRSHFRSRLR